MDWQPIDTLPPGQVALLYLEYPARLLGETRDEYRETRMEVGWYWLETRREEEVVVESRDERHYRYRDRVEKCWSGEWSATHWMPLPDAPPAVNSASEEK